MTGSGPDADLMDALDGAASLGLFNGQEEKCASPLNPPFRLPTSFLMILHGENRFIIIRGIGR